MKPSVFIKSITAGILVSIGATSYLLSDNKFTGSILFSFGLIMICNYGLELFTGKAGYYVENPNTTEYLVVWVGNFIGTIVTSIILQLADSKIHSAAVEYINSKSDLLIVHYFFTGIVCGMIMFLLVDNFRKNKTSIGKYLTIVIGIPVFITAGFEHSIANMFYFVSALENVTDLAYYISIILLTTCANWIGAISMWILIYGVHLKSEEIFDETD